MSSTHVLTLTTPQRDTVLAALALLQGAAHPAPDAPGVSGLLDAAGIEQLVVQIHREGVCHDAAAEAAALRKRRQRAADDAYCNFDFAASVVGDQGWEYDSDGTEWKRTVHLESEDGSASRKVRFTVHFAAPDSDRVEHCEVD